MVFMSIFNFLEPAVTVIAQAIPMFRVLLVNVAKGTTSVHASPTEGNKSNGYSQQMRTWNSKVLGETRKEGDEELLYVRVDRTVLVSSTVASAGDGVSDFGDDKMYDGALRQH